MNLAIVVSKFNKEVTSGLLRGAKQYLEEHDVYVRETDALKRQVPSKSRSSRKRSRARDISTA